MRKLDFLTLITESVAQLQSVEKQQTVARLRLRVQFLRLLKTGAADSIKTAARMVGVSPKRGYEWWELYRNKPPDEYLRLNYKPRRARLSDEQQAQLVRRAGTANGFASQREVREYLADEFQIAYTQPGVCLLLGRLKIKAKVPRPANAKANREDQAEYKKTFIRG
jgi:transposase